MTQVLIDSFNLSFIFPTDDMNDSSIKEMIEHKPKVRWARENDISVKVLTFDNDQELKRDYHIIAEMDDYQRTEYFLRF
jgi:hypothetical protein